jgi:hypothetical protein
LKIVYSKLHDLNYKQYQYVFLISINFIEILSIF